MSMVVAGREPLAAVLATVTILIWLFPLLRRVLRLRRRSEARS